MHITNISITSIRRSLNGKRLLGDVNFEIGATEITRARNMKVSCDTLFSNKIRSDAVLLGDAIRQLRRLPQIRSGQERLTFEPGLKPLATSRKSEDTMDSSARTG